MRCTHEAVFYVRTHTEGWVLRTVPVNPSTGRQTIRKMVDSSVLKPGPCPWRRRREEAQVWSGAMRKGQMATGGRWCLLPCQALWAAQG